jgi:formate hydrogenlyase subunit 6/NADH:ubiquinone oxidoreductase subunit I
MEALHLIDMPSVQGRKTTLAGKDGVERELTNRKGRVSELDPGRCIGCGVCVYKCPTQSLSLKRTQADHHPPQTGRDWIMRYMEDIKAARQKA